MGSSRSRATNKKLKFQKLYKSNLLRRYQAPSTPCGPNFENSPCQQRTPFRITGTPGLCKKITGPFDTRYRPEDVPRGEQRSSLPAVMDFAWVGLCAPPIHPQRRFFPFVRFRFVAADSSSNATKPDPRVLAIFAFN